MREQTPENRVDDQKQESESEVSCNQSVKLLLFLLENTQPVPESVRETEPERGGAQRTVKPTEREKIQNKKNASGAHLHCRGAPLSVIKIEIEILSFCKLQNKLFSLQNIFVKKSTCELHAINNFASTRILR